MDRPRVVLFAPVYPPRMGGSATYFSNLVTLLKDRIDFTVVCLETEGYPDKEWIDGVLVLRVLPDEYASHPIKRYINVLPRALTVLNSLRKSGPYILQAHSNGMYGFSASLFSQIFRVPMIKEVQDTSDPAWNLKTGRVIHWVSCGNHVSERLRKMGMPPERIESFTIINPPDLNKMIDDMKGKVKKPSDRIRMVYVGWLMNRVKGVDILIDAFRKAHSVNDRIELVIIGDGPDRNSLELRATGLPVTFTGELGHEKVIEYYLSSHISVMASHEEAAGRIYIEGYAAGIPAIGTRVGGTPEVLINGRTGILVEDNDIKGLSDAMLELAGDEKLRERYAIGGKELLEEIGGWERLTDWYHSAYNAIWNEMQR